MLKKIDTRIECHKLDKCEIDLSFAIEQHSADKIVAYKKVDGAPIYLGYYLPNDFHQNRDYPLFFFIHGGGWESRKIFPEQKCWQGDYLGYLARYYANKGFIGVCIDYRLVREHGQTYNYGIIECYEDCCDALDYVIAQAIEYGIDTKQMFLLGESAGGHLAGALATFHYDRHYVFQKIFLVNPITNLDDEWKSRVPVDSYHPQLSKLAMEERAKFLSPLYQVQKGIGEIVLIHGKEDTTVNPMQSIMFYNKMLELGQKCELHLIENTKHAFLLAEYYRDGLEACNIAIKIINHRLD